jgi:hypothetical protein
MVSEKKNTRLYGVHDSVCEFGRATRVATVHGFHRVTFFYFVCLMG